MGLLFLQIFILLKLWTTYLGQRENTIILGIYKYIYQPYPINTLKKVFNNKLIARNEERYNVLNSTWKKPELIIEEFDAKQLERLFRT